MSNRHELGNMIFNLEERKNLKEVKFTKNAVKEVLSYLKELYEIKNKEHEEDRRVADLEAKLAESENRVKDLEFRNKNLEHSLNVAPNANAGQRARIVELRGINHKLKQQLAEKEKEITQRLVIQEKDYDQDKISFALERLEKVKDKALHFYVNDTPKLTGYYVDINEIDNQIKQLKEMK